MGWMHRVWSIDKFTFNGVTYDEDNGGPLDWDFNDDTNEIGDRVASQRYPTVIIPENDLEVTIVMRDPYTALTPGTQSSIVFTLKKDDGVTDEVITFTNMVYLRQRGGGRKSVTGQSTLVFRYSNSVGTGRIAR